MYSIRSKKKQGEKLKEVQGKEEAREGEERGEEEKKRRKRRRGDKREKQKKRGVSRVHKILNPARKRLWSDTYIHTHAISNLLPLMPQQP
jgi:hypothetical protein